MLTICKSLFSFSSNFVCIRKIIHTNLLLLFVFVFYIQKAKKEDAVGHPLGRLITRKPFTKNETNLYIRIPRMPKERYIFRIGRAFRLRIGDLSPALCDMHRTPCACLCPRPWQPTNIHYGNGCCDGFSPYFPRFESGLCPRSALRLIIFLSALQRGVFGARRPYAS